MAHRLLPKGRLRDAARAVAAWPKPLRIAVGVLLIVGGLLGFLPILGFWMIPLGVIVLALDFRPARNLYISMVRRWRRWREKRNR